MSKTNDIKQSILHVVKEGEKIAIHESPERQDGPDAEGLQEEGEGVERRNFHHQEHRVSASPGFRWPSRAADQD